MVISNVDMVGKFKRKLNERCLDCGENLELRTILEPLVWDGEEITVKVDKKVCVKCGEVTETEKETRHWRKGKRNIND